MSAVLEREATVVRAEARNGSFAARVRALCDDRVNAVLVKEVRQALRGRAFRILFTLTILAATVVAVAILVDAQKFARDDVGRDFFGSLHLLLAIATLGLVPFSAFVSMSAESEENTYDLLVISNLRPRSIVLGKLSAAAVEATLYFSAFAPFLVFAFLLRGVGIGSVLLVLAATFAGSLSLSALAIAASCFTRTRAARVVLMAAVAGALAFAVVGAYAFAQITLRSPGGWQLEELFGLVVTVVLPGVFGVVLACHRLAHVEENRSSGMRLLASAVLVVFLAYVASLAASGWRFKDVADIGVALFFGAGVFATFFATEPETLPRRVRMEVPRARSGALLAAAFLPGGGRGWLLFCLHVGTLLAFFGILDRLHPTVPAIGSERGTQALLISAGFAILCVGIPARVFRHRSASAFGRNVARVGVLALAVVSFAAPTVLEYIAGDPQGNAMFRMFDPIGTYRRTFWDGPHAKPAAFVLVVVVLIVLAANAPRVIAGVREVLRASAERRASERRAAP